MPFPNELMIGTYAGGTAGMVKLVDLYATGRGIRSKSVDVVPVHYSRNLKLGDGTLMGQGWLQCEWHLNGIRHIHWNVLYSTYRTGQNTQLYIRTYSEDGRTFANYLANMLWPENPPNREHDTDVVLDFNLIFTQLVLQP